MFLQVTHKDGKQIAVEVGIIRWVEEASDKIRQSDLRAATVVMTEPAQGHSATIVVQDSYDSIMEHLAAMEKL